MNACVCVCVSVCVICAFKMVAYYAQTHTLQTEDLCLYSLNVCLHMLTARLHMEILSDRLRKLFTHSSSARQMHIVLSLFAQLES